MSNPFHDARDWALQGKKCRVVKNNTSYVGFVEKLNHADGSLVMHNTKATSLDGSRKHGSRIGSVYVESPEVVEVIYRRRIIEDVNVDVLQDHPNYIWDADPTDYHMRRCYRNQFAGGFPVVDQEYTIINGHKRVAAIRAVGLDKHPVEVVSVNEETRDELFKLAHRDRIDQDRDLEAMREEMNSESTDEDVEAAVPEAEDTPDDAHLVPLGESAEDAPVAAEEDEP